MDIQKPSGRIDPTYAGFSKLQIGSGVNRTYIRSWVGAEAPPTVLAEVWGSWGWALRMRVSASSSPPLCSLADMGSRELGLGVVQGCQPSQAAPGRQGEWKPLPHSLAPTHPHTPKRAQLGGAQWGGGLLCSPPPMLPLAIGRAEALLPCSVTAQGWSQLGTWPDQLN